MDPLDKIQDAKKVSEAAKTAYAEMDWYREVYKIARDEFAGPWHYNSHLASNRWEVGSLGGVGSTQMPINLIDELIGTYIPNLCGTEITAKLTAERTSLRGWATLRQAKLNQQLKSMEFASTDRLVVHDAMLSGMGIYRVGVNQGSDMLHMNGRLGARTKQGESWVRRVSPRCSIRDPESDNYDKDRFQGEIYTVEREWAMSLGICNNDVLEQMDCTHELAPVDADGPNKEALALVDMIQLVDMVVFKGGKAYEMTIPAWGHGPDDQFVIDPREYDGCELGMFEYLTLQNINDRTIGKSPVQTLMDLHLALVAIAKRNVEAALRLKRNFIFRQDQADQVEDLRTAPQDGFIAGDPSGVLPVVQGGVTEEGKLAYDFLRGMANSASPNIDLTSGKGTGANTATLASILQGNSTVIIQGSKELVSNSRINIIRRLSDYEDTYQGPASNITHAMPDGKKIELTYDPAARQGEWSDFNHDVGVTTSQAQEPNMKQARVAQVMTAAPMFLEAVAQLQGNMQAASDMIANQFVIPEFSDIFPTPQAQQIDQAMGQMVPGPVQPAGARVLKGGKAAPMGANPSAPINQIRSDYAGSTPTGQ